MEGGKRNQLKSKRNTVVNKLVAVEPRILNKVNNKGDGRVSLMNRNKSKNESN
jgi:hypothetical protein